MPTKRGLAAAMLVALSSCAPQPVDRVSLHPPATATGGTGGGGAGGAIGQTGGVGGGGGMFQGAAGGSATGGAVDARPVSAPPDGRAAAPDRSPERPPNPQPLDGPPDLSRDTAPDALPMRVVQIVVANPDTLQPGDVMLRTTVATRLPGVIIRPRDDAAPVDLVDTVLIVIAGSVDSMAVGTKYRDVPIPVITCELDLFDEMGLTGPVAGTDFGQEGSGTELTILDATHPLAAGLSGTVTVAQAGGNVAWGIPAATAARVASLPGAASRLAIFAYSGGAQMTMGIAPAKRIGFFAREGAAARLTGVGIQLLGAALEWAIQPN